MLRFRETESFPARTSGRLPGEFHSSMFPGRKAAASNCPLVRNTRARLACTSQRSSGWSRSSTCQHHMAMERTQPACSTTRAHTPCRLWFPRHPEKCLTYRVCTVLALPFRCTCLRCTWSAAHCRPSRNGQTCILYNHLLFAGWSSSCMYQQDKGAKRKHLVDKKIQRDSAHSALRCWPAERSRPRKVRIWIDRSDSENCRASMALPLLRRRRISIRVGIASTDLHPQGR